MKGFFTMISFIILAGAVFPLAGKEVSASDIPEPPENLIMEGGMQKAVFAGGCFWGVEGVFERLKGVEDVVSGYSGGDEDTASYYVVAGGSTGHAESVMITYDSAVISYGTLLQVFFSIAHDPTQLNSQGPDHGTQYRSAIFFNTPQQKKAAEEYIRLLDKAKVYPKKIVTEVSSLKKFYPAESYHQDFMRKNPDYPYIVYWDLPKVKHLEEAFPELLEN
jgi:peptide-methionine (S)-S-oxide reductase